MMHPCARVSFVSPQIGYGVYATEFIPAGTIVYAQDALEIEVFPDDPRLADPTLAEPIEKYSYIDARGVRLISWDVAKYVNHCCAPNTMSAGYGFEIALRDIEPGEELTDEYGMFNMTHALDCYCGAPGCRKVVRASDLDVHHAAWDAALQRALQRLRHVPQPLAGLVDEDTWTQLDRFLESGQDYVSVRALRHVSGA